MPPVFTVRFTRFALFQLDYMTNVSAFFSEYLTSAVLMISILAFTDPHNMAAPSGLLPLALFILILGIGVALGMETGTFSFVQLDGDMY